MATSSVMPGSVTHAHPDLEQATYVIEGEASVEVDGIKHTGFCRRSTVLSGEVFHDIQVISERIKLLVIYAPPYGEDPTKVIKLQRPSSE